MTHARRPPAKSRLASWLGWAGLDAVSRLALMSGSTIVFSRLLAPYDFGVTALVLTIVTVAAIFVGAPFEEALTQRRHLRKAHLRAALSLSWLIGLVIFVLSILAGRALAQFYGEPEIAFLLPVAMCSIFFSGHSDILTALARRQRKFNDVAYATLLGHIVGVGIAVCLAFMGYGLWALIAQRLLVVVARALILQARIGFIIMPSRSLSHIGDLSRYARISFLSRLTDTLTYLAFNNLVQILYGTTMLGQVNMAMRLIEPIRGAIVATGHNLAFTFFTRAGRNVEKLRQIGGEVVSQSALATAPIFVGMAAVAPVLLPLVAGPGWDDAAMIAVCLSLAGAIGAPAGLIFTAFSSQARPEFSLYSLATGLCAIVLVLFGLAWLGPISVGLSRIAGDTIRALFAILLPVRDLEWPRRERFAALAPAWGMAGAMGAGVVLLRLHFGHHAALLQLAVLVVAGVLIYIALLAVFARRRLSCVLARLPLARFTTKRFAA
ncbi:MAG: oligosaccharide flippase family protein [Rhodoblastus sp.]